MCSQDANTWLLESESTSWFVSFNHQSSSGIDSVALEPRSCSPLHHPSSGILRKYDPMMSFYWRYHFDPTSRSCTAQHCIDVAQEELQSKTAIWTKCCLFPWQLSVSGSETSSPTSSATIMTSEMMKTKGSLKVSVFTGAGTRFPSGRHRTPRTPDSLRKDCHLH